MKYGFLSDVSDVDFQLPNDSPFNEKFILQQDSPLELYVGCSVWADKDYVGTFYPEKTPQKNYLKAYAQQFNAVEVNATRYGVPAESTLETWKNAVHDDFRLSFKLPQIISQRKNLLAVDVLERLDQYILAMDKMGKRAGTTFVLLQNNFSKERLPELESFLKHLPEEQEYAFEIRNPELNSTHELGSLLNKYNRSHVITDTAGRRDVVHQMITNNTAYIRFVGNGLVPTDYSRIDAWVQKIKKWTAQGVNKVYFLVHQPEQKRSLSGLTVKYMIEQINKEIPQSNLKVPIDYTNQGQATLF